MTFETWSLNTRRLAKDGPFWESFSSMIKVFSLAACKWCSSTFFSDVSAHDTFSYQWESMSTPPVDVALPSRIPWKMRISSQRCEKFYINKSKAVHQRNWRKLLGTLDVKLDFSLAKIWERSKCAGFSTALPSIVWRSGLVFALFFWSNWFILTICSIHPSFEIFGTVMFSTHWFDPLYGGDIFEVKWWNLSMERVNEIDRPHEQWLVAM